MISAINKKVQNIKNLEVGDSTFPGKLIRKTFMDVVMYNLG